MTMRSGAIGLDYLERGLGQRKPCTMGGVSVHSHMSIKEIWFVHVHVISTGIYLKGGSRSKKRKSKEITFLVPCLLLIMSRHIS